MANYVYFSILYFTSLFNIPITLGGLCVPLICIASVLLLFHIYVVASYNFRVDYWKEPVQYLFESLSAYEAFNCLLFGITFYLDFENLDISSFHVEETDGRRKWSRIFQLLFFSSTDVIGAHLVALLLAINRYFSIVDIRYYGYFFTKWKIRLYFLLIMAFNFAVNVVLIVVGLSLNAILSRENKHSDEPDVKVFWTFIWVKRVVKTIFSVVIIMSIACLYSHVQRFKSSDISFKEEMNKISVEISNDDDNESTPLRLRNIFEESIKMDKLYLKSVNVSVFATVACFLIHDILEWIVFGLSMHFWVCFHDETMENCFREFRFLYSDPVIFPAVVNPIVFLLNNADFRIKLKRPFRVLKNWILSICVSKRKMNCKIRVK